MLLRSAALRASVRPLTRGALARPGSAIARRHASSDAVATTSSGGDLATEKAPEQDPESLSAFTGAPADMLRTRVVKIYQQAQTVQNATQNMIPWRMQWEDNQTKRWTNPLMGWTSTSDPLSNTHMTLEFGRQEDAIRFCQQQGWKYEVVESKPNKEIFASPKKYADNFKWKGGKGRYFPDLYKPPPPPPPPPKS